MAGEERECGPLEEEIRRLMGEAALGDPLALELSTGEIDLGTFAAEAGDLSDAQSIALFVRMAVRLIPAQKQAILRLAQEIDAIKASSDGGE